MMITSRNISKGWIFLSVLSLPIIFTACAASVSPDKYSVGSVGQVNRAIRGTIVSVRKVEIDRSTGTGQAAGAAIGAAGGAAIGDGAAGSVAAAVAGAVIGGVVGSAAEKNAVMTTGFEYVVEAANGALLTIVQGGESFSVGDEVIVLYGQRSRIIPSTRKK